MEARKGSWIVKVKKTVVGYVVCHNCTETQATEDPYAYATDEFDEETTDWEVKDVKENT